MEKLSVDDLKEILSYRKQLTQQAANYSLKAPRNLMDDRTFIGFLDALNYTGFVENFDYISWAEKENKFNHSAANMIDHVKEADLDELRRLMTMHIRRERFSEGHMQKLYETGFFDYFFERLEVLKDQE